MKHPDVSDRVYQLLGNSYDNLGKSDKAIETYQEGLNLFPNSGPLYLEMGVVYLRKEEYNKALVHHEKGIKMDPQFPSNYYWATRLYCGSTEEVWGMIYGEIFMNLERNSRRTAEISKILFDTYKSEIKFISDSTFSVSFSKNSTINIDDLQGENGLKLPFGIGVYEPTLMLSTFLEKRIDLKSLNSIRSRFVENYYKNGHDKSYPNLLFTYQKKLVDNGHFEAYNHWLLMKGDENEFNNWKINNNEKWDGFIKWFNENQLEIDRTNSFYSGQF